MKLNPIKSQDRLAFRTKRWIEASVAVFLVFTGAAHAQLAEEDVEQTYFHPAAAEYIQGQLQAASNIVVEGLAVAPDDTKLLKLLELIKNPPEQDQQKQDQQNQENQDQQDQNQEQDQQDQNEQQQDEPQNEDPNQNEENEQNPSNEHDPQPTEPEPQPSAEQMSEDEAKQLLDAMKQEERNKRLQLHPKLVSPVKVDKDW